MSLAKRRELEIDEEYTKSELAKFGIRTDDPRVEFVGGGKYYWLGDEEDEDDEDEYNEPFWRKWSGKLTDEEIVSRFERKCRNYGIGRLDIWEAFDASFRSISKHQASAKEIEMKYEPGKLNLRPEVIYTPQEATKHIEDGTSFHSRDVANWQQKNGIEAWDGERWIIVRELTLGLFYKADTILNLGLDMRDGDFQEVQIPDLDRCGRTTGSRMTLYKYRKTPVQQAVVAPSKKSSYEPTAASKVVTPTKVHVDLGLKIVGWLKIHPDTKPTWDIVRTFNPADSTKVLRFAEKIQDDLALFSDQLLKIGTFNATDVDKYINELAEYFKSGTKAKGFWGAASSLFNSDTDGAFLDTIDMEEVDKKVFFIKESVNDTDMRIRAFEAAMEENNSYHNQLKLHIQAAEAIAVWGTWVQTQGDMWEGVSVRDIMSNLKFLDRKSYDLRLLLVSSEQTVAQLIMGKETLMSRIDQVNKVIRISVPLWKKQVATYRTLKNANNQKTADETLALLMKTQCDIVNSVKAA